MRAFLKSLHLGGTKDREKEPPPRVQKEKFPPLRSWPPEEPNNRATTTTAVSYTSFKPLPEVVAEPPLSTQGALDDSSRSETPPPPPSRDELDHSTSPRRDSDSASSNKTVTVTPTTVSTTADVQKKVAFISPSTTPTPAGIDRTLSHDSATVPMKTTLSRFQATYGKEAPRSSTSSNGGASSSKTELASGKASVKAASTRATSPYLHKPEQSAQSLRSGTPYSNMSNTTSGSRILAAQSWSEVTEEDLVSNLGSRERTRQEVLFEIIQSEERYVQELVKMKDTFIDPLLHPFSTSSIPPTSSTPNLDYDYYRSESPVESNDLLPPIAARFMSPSPAAAAAPSTPSRKAYTPTPIIDGESMESDDDADDEAFPRAYTAPKKGTSQAQAAKHNHPRSPYRATASKVVPVKPHTSVPFPTRSHHSLPPPPRMNPASASTHSLGRQSSMMDRERERNNSQGQASVAQRKNSMSAQSKTGVLRKLKKSETSNAHLFGDHVAPHQLPEDLRICLEVIDSGVFDGHKRLSEALKKRYDDQFPLVRSLADVFVSNSDIFKGYAKYVLHLERALEQVDNALSNAATTKKPKNQDVAEWQKVCKTLQRLEESACDKGETGLAITLSKSFQRLLKYPLLFQNLLFHTDPSTFEYESTLQMVAEVEAIVRSIEDEKIQKEERDKTRDVFARIEGLDKVRQLALPKPSRVLVEERQCNSGPGSSGLKSSSPPPIISPKNVRGKSSFKRLSDALSSAGKKDLWFVVFNDVVLQCQRTGTTSLPLVSSTTSRTNSLPELQGKAKYATTGRRNSHTRPRNMYKFIKIETWTINDANARAGVVSMDDVARSRVALSNQPKIVPLPDDDEDGEGDSDDSDKKSKMSFSYWGADKVTVQKPIVKPKVGVTTRRGGHVASYGRESSANAKFGTRLVSNDNTSPNARPASRRTQGTSSRRDDYSKATVTRPEWNTSTRPPLAVTPKRVRNTSQTSGATGAARTAVTAAKAMASPAPSEDSGVGLYRQMLANDPSLNP